MKSKSLPALLALLALAFVDSAPGADAATAADSVLLFTSFRKNGEDGLHLAWSRDGFEWKALRNDKSFLAPKVGGGLMRDPNLIQGPDGTFHMVWTTAWNKHGVGYASSRDLLNWSEQSLFDVMKHEPAARNIWAPELFYDTAARQFLIFWSSTIAGRFPTSEKRGDDGYNHRLYLTTTRDFTNFAPTRLFYDPGFNCIDATLVADGPRTVMFLKDETRQPPAKNIIIATADSATGPYWQAVRADHRQVLGGRPDRDQTRRHLVRVFRPLHRASLRRGDVEGSRPLAGRIGQGEIPARLPPRQRAARVAQSI